MMFLCWNLCRVFLEKSLEMKFLAHFFRERDAMDRENNGFIDINSAKGLTQKIDDESVFSHQKWVKTSRTLLLSFTLELFI